MQSFGDDVQCKELRLYTTFKTLRNFATVVLQRSRLLVYLHLDVLPTQRKFSTTFLQRVMCLPSAIGARETLKCPSLN